MADELIGYGASAQVWRGHVGRGAEPVALKVLDLRDGSAVRTAKAEAALLSALDHPNLMRLRELVPDGDSIVLVLELAAGGSLAHLLHRRVRLSPGEAVAALSPIAAALAYAHDAGVVHSDVSPANVLFRADGSPLLADLGVARLVGGFDVPRSTLAYVDPGVAGGAVPSAASDVFMCAATALHALTGSPPWPGDTAEAVLQRAVTGQIEGLPARLSGLPGPVAEVIRRGLDPSPIARGSAAEFALDLRHAAVPVPVDLDAGPTVSALGQHRPAAAGAGSRGRLPTRTPISPVAAEVVREPGRPRAPRQPAGPPHVPRHAAAGVPAGATSAATWASAAPVDVSLGRPDFMRPGSPDTAIRRTDGPRTDGPRTDGPRTDGPRTDGPRTDGPRTDGPRTDGPRTDGGASRSSATGSASDWVLPTPDVVAERTGDSAANAWSSEVESSDAPLALTHVVRSRIRADEPPRGRRLRVGAPRRFASLIVAVAVVVLLAGGTAAWLRWRPVSASHRQTRAVAGARAAAGGEAGNGDASGNGDGSVRSRNEADTASSTSAPVATSQDSQAPSAPRATPAATSIGGGSAGPAPSAGTSTARPSPGSARTSVARTEPTPAGTTSASTISPSTTWPSTTWPSTTSPSTTSPSTTSPSTTSPSTTWPGTTSSSTDADWTAVLAALDRGRQRAYAGNDPAALSAVYANAALLRQDRSTLRQVVPAGCRLVGLRTLYRDVHASEVSTHQAVLSAQASLKPAKLVCGQSIVPIAAHATVPMTIVLQPVDGQSRIEAIQVSA